MRGAVDMAERSFKKEVEHLKKGDGERFVVKAFLPLPKHFWKMALAMSVAIKDHPSVTSWMFLPMLRISCQAGSSFEASASEATAAATLAASVHYPIRGAVTFKSTVGTNVASDALANLASGGVTGGALVIVGEDYGEGSSIMQERSHAFAMKSQIWLLDPRPNLTKIVESVGHVFALSEVSNSPVMLQMRVKSCHMLGAFIAKDNKRPQMSVKGASPSRDIERIVLPPPHFCEQEKVTKRRPAAISYIQDHGLNEIFTPETQAGPK